MATQHRSNNSAFPQEHRGPIARVALYGRVSTLNHQDPKMQLVELREYAERRGWLIVQEYVDQGVSGSKESRPALNRLMSDAYFRKFDAILVWKIESIRPIAEALGECLGGTGRSRSGIHQLARQP